MISRIFPPFFSPTQDVQDLYKPPAALQRPPDSESGYNPRQDLFGVGSAGNNPAWEANYGPSGDHNQSHSVQPVRGDPRAARRDPRRRE